MKSGNWASTGINGLDEIINHLRKGDNVVWQVDDIKDYAYFVTPFVENALKEKRKIVYMRFAQHKELVNDTAIKTYRLDATTGFESFSIQMHNIVKEEGADTYYVFDCLSDLLQSWATDLMIGNFFVVTCPFLFELDTVAYFAILRNNHSFKTIARIRETTQLLLDLYDFDGNYYLHPLKVWNRYSHTMFLPHLKEGDKFSPLTNSIDAARLLSHISEKGIEPSERNLDYWDRLFISAEKLSRTATLQKKWEMTNQLSRIMLGREKRIMSLVKSNFTLEDLLSIKSRMIGTGFIGGKSMGMLLARNILKNDASFDWQRYLEQHDSFYIGSDFFYTYLVQNGWWKLRMEQRTKEGYFSVAAELKEKMLKGRFPDEIKEQLWQMIEYFGQSPIIIRSSSLLEDSFGNAFAGKYESIFSVNQSSPERRYAQLEEYIRRIFASTMNEDALAYRRQRGLDQQDEQMALLVQRVSGSYKKHYFYPDAAGVGISYNTFVWKEDMDPKAGMLRLVFGLGTRAVNRVEDDYPAIAALDGPLLKPNADKEDEVRFSQHKVDLLDISQNSFMTLGLAKLLGEKPGGRMELIGRIDSETNDKMRQLGIQGEEAWIINFDRLFTDTDFREVMQKMLKTLESAYHYPVDIEFTVNFTEDGGYRVNLLQCRPLQTRGRGKRVEIPKDIPREKTLLVSDGNFMGGNISQHIRRIIYVKPELYNALPEPEKYAVARLVGKLNRQISDRDETPALLIGPGRWGTSTPSLGVPVNFAEINNVTVLVEVDFSTANVSPELSFGTHFFQDLVETNIFYAAIFSDRNKGFFNSGLLEGSRQNTAALDKENDFGGAVRVYDFPDNSGPQLMADIVSQKLICFIPLKNENL